MLLAILYLAGIILALFILLAAPMYLIDLWFRRKLKKYEQELKADAAEKQRQKPRLPPDVQAQVDAFLAEMDRDLQEMKRT